MSDAIQQATLFHRMRYTPLRDAVRGRLTARLDVEGRMERAGLPAPARELIRRVVRRTRLWRVERADVADELIAHFADGLEGGRAVHELVASFGDERVAAKLIRRAKRRNRPLAWHAMVFARRLVLALVAAYLLLAVYYYTGRPSPRVDYLAQLNERTAAIPEDQRAWPIYREAILAAGLQPYEHDRPRVPQSPEKGYARPGDPHWPEMVSWLERNAEALGLARQAAHKPALGLPITAWGREVDPVLVPTVEQKRRLDESLTPEQKRYFAEKATSSSLENASTIHLAPLWELAEALAADAFLATRRGDLARAIDDVAALEAMSDQLREHNVLWDYELSLQRRQLAQDAALDLLARAGAKLTQADLRRLAHVFAGPDTASDLIDVGATRTRAYDRLQHLYTDDGDGDGRLTPRGVALLNGFPSGSYLSGPRLFVPGKVSAASMYFGDPLAARRAFQRAVVPAAPMLVASRREAADAIDRMTGLAQANLQKPLREADWREYNRLTREFSGARYAAVHVPNASDMHRRAENHLGRRDGLLVAVALESYRREHDGRLPESLDALAPHLLPRVPVDRMTGGPLRYRVVDGQLVVYSVGDDGDDDGGRAPVQPWDGKPAPSMAAWWRAGNQPAADGDWVLYPAIPATPDE